MIEPLIALLTRQRSGKDKERKSQEEEGGGDVD